MLVDPPLLRQRHALCGSLARETQFRHAAAARSRNHTGASNRAGLRDCAQPDYPLPGPVACAPVEAK
jgi:hypothetical protein